MSEYFPCTYPNGKPHKVESAPGSGSFVLTVTQGNNESSTASHLTIPVIGFALVEHPKQRLERIFEVVRCQKQNHWPIIAWQEELTGPCSFYINDVVINPALTLIQTKKTEKLLPSSSPYPVSKTYQIIITRSELVVEKNELSNLFWLVTSDNLQTDKPLTVMATLEGQTPEGQPLKAVLSFHKQL